MKISKEEEKTTKFYDDNAEEWVSSHSGGRFWGGEIDRFYELLPSGKLLEIGSGGGRDAKDLIKLGYEYVGTDISEGLLKEARKHNPGATFLKQSVYDLDFPENTFDGFWASAVLLHIPKDRISEALGTIHNVVKAGGIGFIAIKQGLGEKVEKEGRFFAYYDNGEFKDKLEESDFEIVDSKVRPVSENTTWLIYFVKVKK
jgi:ubiquinone/menaquinone biosynthesis C-methylase UbiE